MVGKKVLYINMYFHCILEFVLFLSKQTSTVAKLFISKYSSQKELPPVAKLPI